MTTRLNGRVTSVDWGNAKSSVNTYISLAPFPSTNNIMVQVECLKTGKACANLYFPYVFVAPQTSPSGFLEWVIIFAILALTSASFWILLGFGESKGVVTD